jgi:hypothetical protein
MLAWPARPTNRPSRSSPATQGGQSKLRASVRNTHARLQWGRQQALLSPVANCKYLLPERRALQR